MDSRDLCQAGCGEGFRVAVLALVVAAGVAVALPADAGSIWDPNEPGHVLDIRWVGVVEQTDGRLRVTIDFYDPIRLRWFNRPGDFATLSVRLAPERSIPPYWGVHVTRDWHRGLSARLCDDGSICQYARVTRLDATTIRIWVTPMVSPFSGWYFRGITRERESLVTGREPPVIDRTAVAAVD